MDRFERLSLVSDIGSNIKVLFGSDITLICDSRGLPTPNTTWTSNGTYLGEGERLLLTNMEKADPVIYTCTAENLAGKVSRDSSVTILSKLLNVLITEKGVRVRISS